MTVYVAVVLPWLDTSRRGRIKVRAGRREVERAKPVDLGCAVKLNHPRQVVEIHAPPPSVSLDRVRVGVKHAEQRPRR